jgi:hypothetical protein
MVASKGDDLLAARLEVGVIFLVVDVDIGQAGARHRGVAVRIVLDPDDGLGSDERADPRQDIALAIIVALRHHCAVQERTTPSTGRAAFSCRISSRISSKAARDRAAGLGGETGAFDQGVAFRRRPPARYLEHVRLVQNLARMGAGRIIELLLEGGE